MVRVAEPTSTPVKVANSATAALSTAGVDLRTLIAKLVATLPSVPVAVAHQQLLSLQQSWPQHQHVRLQLLPQHPPRKSPPTPPVAPTTAELLAWAAPSATAAAARGGADRQQTTAEAHVKQGLEIVVVTTPQAQARQSRVAQPPRLRLLQQLAAFCSA
jgi:hypothetical protein